MPELPEVETVMRGLSARMTGKQIASIELRRSNLRFPLPPALSLQTAGTRITHMERISKYIIIHLDTGDRLLWHLGMTGRFSFHDTRDYKPAPHDHIIIHLTDGQSVVYNDARRFGIADFWPHDVSFHKLLSATGVDPFSKRLTGAWLFNALSSRRQSMKAVLMDQRIIAGLGNIYVSEALFRAGIDPQRSATTLTRQQATALLRAIRAVLSEAIKAGGSTLRDYVQADGSLGYFQHVFRVYGREEKPCRSCGTPIRRIVQQGRSTFFCPECQQ